MTAPQNISIRDYTYNLPDEKIALHPLEQRDASKLLIYKEGVIQEDIYQNIYQYLPVNSLLIFNNSKVIKARILFTKPTGGVIEIFCLEPYETNSEYSSVMNKKKRVKWKCMIGGAGKWKEKFLTWKSVTDKLELKAELIEKLPDAYIVEFSWEPADLAFAEVIEQVGDIPLPPYIKRKTDTGDKERYQTIYAVYDGSVAAPTAGLHFTQNIFSLLAEKNIRSEYVTLHVGAGTFKPVKAAIMQAHEMHAEWIDVTASTIENIQQSFSNTIVATGTTSLRTIESLYWMGVKTILNPETEDIMIRQWDVYETVLAQSNISAAEALTGLLNWMKKNRLERIVTQTQVLIVPGYRFRIANALITNFHQPQSTLLLLVAAAVGERWKNLYDYALQNNFRFLSYGDGSLLFIDDSVK